MRSSVLLFASLLVSVHQHVLVVLGLAIPGQHARARRGSVALVGAGPGDPDLMTVRAVRELEKADVVIADRLVSKEILDMVRGELKVARKLPGCQEKAQAEIYGWMREALENGQRVARLKIGDPFVFGRGGEELLELRKWGFEAEVVPGVSSALSAPLLAGIPVTHRGVANQLMISTGYGRDYTSTDVPPYDPLRTCVLLMAVGRLKQLSQDMLAGGYPGKTPVAIVERASTAAQRIVVATVDDVAEVAKEHGVCAPACIVVGEVVDVTLDGARGLIHDRLRDITFSPQMVLESRLSSSVF
jgi:uroporphyrin-III C-methyltransferase